MIIFLHMRLMIKSKKTIKMYEDLIQKLENQLKNEFTEYVV